MSPLGSMKCTLFTLLNCQAQLSIFVVFDILILLVNLSSAEYKGDQIAAGEHRCKLSAVQVFFFDQEHFNFMAICPYDYTSFYWICFGQQPHLLLVLHCFT
jgi:hypothetical protein